MASLNFETGLKTFSINGDESRVISFAPSDATFLNNLSRAMETLEERNEKTQKEIDGASAASEVYRIACEFDKEIRGIIDGVFGYAASEIAFGSINVCGVADGAPIWAGFLIAVVEECDEHLTTQQTASNPRLKKLLAKYGKKK